MDRWDFLEQVFHAVAEYLDPDVQKAFEHPEDFDWSGIPNHLESTLMAVIEKGEVIIYHWTLYDRKRMQDIVNANRRESIQFTPLPLGGLEIKVVQ